MSEIRFFMLVNRDSYQSIFFWWRSIVCSSSTNLLSCLINYDDVSSSFRVTWLLNFFIYPEKWSIFFNTSLNSSDIEKNSPLSSLLSSRSFTYCFSYFRFRLSSILVVDLNFDWSPGKFDMMSSIASCISLESPLPPRLDYLSFRAAPFLPEFDKPLIALII